MIVLRRKDLLGQGLGSLSRECSESAWPSTPEANLDLAASSALEDEPGETVFKGLRPTRAQLREAALDWFEGRQQWAPFLDRDLDVKFSKERSSGKGGQGSVLCLPDGSGDFFKCQDPPKDSHLALKFTVEQEADGTVRLVAPSRAALRTLQTYIALKTLDLDRAVPELQLFGVSGDLEIVLRLNGLPDAVDFNSPRVKGLPRIDQLRLLTDAARRIAVFHESGFIHNDIKPGNLITDLKRAMLIDLGFARHNGEIFGGGTRSFRPEEWNRGVDSDLYSFGVALDEVLAVAEDDPLQLKELIDTLLAERGDGTEDGVEQRVYGSMWGVVSALERLCAACSDLPEWQKTGTQHVGELLGTTAEYLGSVPDAEADIGEWDSGADRALDLWGD